MGSRRKGRVLAFQALFSYEASHTEVEELLSYSWLNEEEREKFPEDSELFGRLLISGTIEKIEDIDEEIKKQLVNWDFSRLAKVDLAILRLSVYSIKYQKDIPSSVTIDEAVDIAKEYGSDESFRFINGVLDGIRKRLEGEK